jgi:HPt (histidine-containing phosphotransfer) domain-containing protein
VTQGEVVQEAALERLVRIGGQTFLIEMIDLFLEHAPQRMRSARTAFAEGDHRSLYRSANSLKSTAGNLGARALQHVAERLEAKAVERDMETIPPLLDEMARRYEDVRDRLEAERRRRSGSGDQRSQT